MIWNLNSDFCSWSFGIKIIAWNFNSGILTFQCHTYQIFLLLCVFICNILPQPAAVLPLVEDVSFVENAPSKPPTTAFFHLLFRLFIISTIRRSILHPMMRVSQQIARWLICQFYVFLGYFSKKIKSAGEKLSTNIMSDTAVSQQIAGWLICPARPPGRRDAYNQLSNRQVSHMSPYIMYRGSTHIYY